MKFLRAVGVLGMAMQLFSGCVKPDNTLTVETVNEKEFRIMVSLLEPQLSKRGLVDEDGAWYTPIISLGGVSDAGERLKKLSPSFRYVGLEGAALPSTFGASVTEHAKVKTTSDSFSIDQGMETVYISLLALSDLDQDGVADWLVLCRITQKPEPVVIPVASRNRLKNLPPPKPLDPVDRYYYLRIDNPEASILKGEVMAVLECRNNKCRDITGKTQAANPALELIQGQESVVKPPSEAAPAKPRNEEKLKN